MFKSKFLFCPFLRRGLIVFIARFFGRLLRWLTAITLALGMCGLCVGIIVFYRLSHSLPDYEKLAQWRPYVLTRLYATDGRVLSEVAEQRRYFVPFSRIPPKLIQAFLAAEDKNFYTHHGLDFTGIIRAGAVNTLDFLSGRDRRPIGASTITQQVAKNFFLNSQVSLERKVKEAILAYRLESVLSKEKILELYLNQIYLGFGSYGIASASVAYFGLSIDQLSLAQMAYLAALPKAPNNYHPIRDYKRSITRRNWVLQRMHEDGFIQGEEMRLAQAEPLDIQSNREEEKRQGEYFIEEVKKNLSERYGHEHLLTSGLTVYTTIDLHLQELARAALREGLIAYDRQGPFRGPVAHLSVVSSQKLAALSIPGGDDTWQLAVITYQANDLGTILLPDGKQGKLPLMWQGQKVPLKVGDVVFVTHVSDNLYALQQIPEINGAIVVVDPYTGRLLAMEGGFNFHRSQFNRAMQAVRQPGSVLKPIVYAAALEEGGFTPASLIADTPISIGQNNNILNDWRPKDYQKTFLGKVRLRTALEQSRNLAAVHLVQDVGMPTIIRYVKTFGIQDNMPNLPSMALGAGSTTLVRLAYAYCIFANGGRRVSPVLIDRIQDMTGKVIYRADARPCDDCNAPWQGQMPPLLEPLGQRVLSEQTAFQITSMLQSAVEHGTGGAARIKGVPIAGKTGSTNQEKDAWFIGYTSHLLVGVFVGYDTPRPMGHGQTGGRLAAPIFRAFLEKALDKRAAVPFRTPDHIQFIKINKQTGKPATDADADSDVMFEVFKENPSPRHPRDNSATYVVDSLGGLY